MQRFRLAKKGRRTRVTLAIPGRGDSRSRDTGTCQGVMYLGKKVNGFMRLDLTVHRRSRGDVQLEGCAARYMPSEEVELVLWADGDFHNRGERNDTIRFVFQNRLSLAPVGRMTEMGRCFSHFELPLSVLADGRKGASSWRKLGCF